MTISQQLSHHGVLMNIFGVGTLITGKSGIGKSEIALSLLDRNHQLIADDMPVFIKKDNTIIGTAVQQYREFIHVRGIGIVNAEKIFGPTAIAESNPLHLVIHLQKPDYEELDSFEGKKEIFEIFQHKIPKICIPILSYLNMTIVIETVVKNFLLQATGYDAASEFEKIQKQQLGDHSS